MLSVNQTKDYFGQNKTLIEARYDLTFFKQLNVSSLILFRYIIFIGPESDHWQCLSVTPSLTHCHLVNLIDVTLACEDAYSKLVEVVSVADVSDEDHVVNSLLKIWKLRFGQKTELLFRL